MPCASENTKLASTWTAPEMRAAKAQYSFILRSGGLVRMGAVTNTVPH